MSHQHPKWPKHNVQGIKPHHTHALYMHAFVDTSAYVHLIQKDIHKILKITNSNIFSLDYIN